MPRARLAALLLAVTLWIPAGASMAADDEGPDRAGPYMRMGLNLGFDRFESQGLNAKLDTGIGAELRAGYRFGRWLALEGELDFLHFDSGSLGVDRQFRTVIYTTNLKVPLTSGVFQPYLIGGLGVMWSDMKDPDPAIDETAVGFAGRAGAGLDIFINDHIVLSTDVTYVVPTQNTSDYHIVDWKTGITLMF